MTDKNLCPGGRELCQAGADPEDGFCKKHVHIPWDATELPHHNDTRGSRCECKAAPAAPRSAGALRAASGITLWTLDHLRIDGVEWPVTQERVAYLETVASIIDRCTHQKELIEALEECLPYLEGENIRAYGEDEADWPANVSVTKDIMRARAALRLVKVPQ